VTRRFACIVGARPNFMKMAPILRAFREYPDVDPVLIHTGQHYDAKLSDVFFSELGIKAPEISLGVGSGSHAEQTGKLLVELERCFVEADKLGRPFDRVVVVGDVNSTMAAALAAAKLHLPIAHVEAGLRSRDRTMPEEINRIVTDSLSDLLLVSEPEGVENLIREGHPADRIHLVGNVMIDTLMAQVRDAKQRSILGELGIEPRGYAVVTLHRPSNVDQEETLRNLLQVLVDVSERVPIIFPVHPRTRSKLEQLGGWLSRASEGGRFRLLEPLGYNDFLCLTSQSKVIVTDSGGLQEESTALGIPCLTMRENTERPITVTEGTSTLCGSDSRELARYLSQIEAGTYKQGKCPELWDGNAAVRIVKEIVGGR
jgi:UDP-N-acetylglucosamine 2-epimerase (non-hydrolysing)